MVTPLDPQNVSLVNQLLGDLGNLEADDPALVGLWNHAATILGDEDEIACRVADAFLALYYGGENTTALAETRGARAI